MFLTWLISEINIAFVTIKFFAVCGDLTSSLVCEFILNHVSIMSWIFTAFFILCSCWVEPLFQLYHWKVVITASSYLSVWICPGYSIYQGKCMGATSSWLGILLVQKSDCLLGDVSCSFCHGVNTSRISLPSVWRWRETYLPIHKLHGHN